MRKIKFAVILIGLLLFPIIAFTQNISDYLILQDIGNYKLDKPEKDLPGEPATGGPHLVKKNILSATGHFQDHNDVTYGVMYLSNSGNVSPDVQVTQHTGGDSDRWLLHELDKAFRTSLGIPGDQYIMRVVNGNNIMTFGSAGWVYRWISNNKVISIEYEDGQMTKPEPVEVVNAYLVKFPSTLPAVTSADLRTKDNQSKWIKDEMDRRLWLCDKWNAQSQTGSVKQSDLIYNLVRSMNVFLNYRQKYYNIATDADIKALAGYKQNNDIASIQNKLTEYKTWWAKHKDKRISLP
ncbi:MAG: hypothetical protein LLG40_07070 [Deltaproteobacteria bacterium]|nr:hypothetical protein [Deltaproteobacteria bacterium]